MCDEYKFQCWLERGKLYYLASPFTGYKERQEQRTREVAKIACDIYMSGHEILSPITHSKMIAEAFDCPTSWDFWERLDLALLSRCDALLVVPLSGWQHSVGLHAEISFAVRHEMQMLILQIDEWYNNSSSGIIVEHLNSSFLNEFEIGNRGSE